jgi:stalled ribosome rescue protein Dom34
MKLVWRSMDKNGSGHVSLIAEEPEDMWHVYNLITAGDSLKSTTIRYIRNKKKIVGTLKISQLISPHLHNQRHNHRDSLSILVVEFPSAISIH